MHPNFLLPASCKLRLSIDNEHGKTIVVMASHITGSDSAQDKRNTGLVIKCLVFHRLSDLSRREVVSVFDTDNYDKCVKAVDEVSISNEGAAVIAELVSLLHSGHINQVRAALKTYVRPGFIDDLMAVVLARTKWSYFLPLWLQGILSQEMLTLLIANSRKVQLDSSQQHKVDEYLGEKRFLTTYEKPIDVRLCLERVEGLNELVLPISSDEYKQLLVYLSASIYRNVLASRSAWAELRDSEKQRQVELIAALTGFTNNAVAQAQDPSLKSAPALLKSFASFSLSRLSTAITG
jgi:hypothetical protein